MTAFQPDNCQQGRLGNVDRGGAHNISLQQRVEENVAQGGIIRAETLKGTERTSMTARDKIWPDFSRKTPFSQKPNLEMACHVVYIGNEIRCGGMAVTTARLTLFVIV